MKKAQGLAQPFDRAKRNEERRIKAHRRRMSIQGWHAGRSWVIDQETDLDELERLVEFAEANRIGGDLKLDGQSEQVAVAIAELDPNGERVDGRLVSASNFWMNLDVRCMDSDDFLNGFVEGAYETLGNLRERFGF